jgi:hypothetical protein
VVLLIGVGLWLAVVLAYAGPSLESAVYRLILDGGVLLLWLAGATGLGGLVLRIFEHSKPKLLADPLVIVTATGLGLGSISILVLLLGLVGFLSQAIAIALLGAGLVALIWHWSRDRRTLDQLRRWRSERAGVGWLLLLAVPVTGMMTVSAMIPPFILWKPQDPHPYDVVEYHLQVPREWYEAGHIFPLHHNVFSYLPFNVEMHYLLAMHLRGGPWAGMYLAQLMHSAFMILTVVAAGLVARRLVRQRGAGVVAALAGAGVPMLAQLGAVAYVEGGFLFFGTLSIGWALVALRESESRIRRFAIAGVMAGLACGAKLTALPEVLVMVPALLVVFFLVMREWRLVSVSHRLAALVTFGVCGLLAFGPWLIRTGLWARNPLFPEVQQLGRGPFSETQAERWKHSLEPRPDQKSVAGRLKAGWEQVVGNWQYGFLLIPAAALTLVLKGRDPTVQFLGAMFFLLCIFWLGFTHLQARFFILAAPICALLVASVPRLLLPAVVVQVLVGTIALHVNMTSTPDRPWGAVVQLLGNEVLMPQAAWTPAAVREIPEGAPVALVGDAKAFLYQLPMAKLRYRTVFDVDDTGGKSFFEAYAGPPEPEQVLVIDPDELRRFVRTYHPLPPVPAEVLARDGPYMIRRGMGGGG